MSAPFGTPQLAHRGTRPRHRPRPSQISLGTRPTQTPTPNPSSSGFDLHAAMLGRPQLQPQQPGLLGQRMTPHQQPPDATQQQIPAATGMTAEEHKTAQLDTLKFNKLSELVYQLKVQTASIRDQVGEIGKTQQQRHKRQQEEQADAKAKAKTKQEEEDTLSPATKHSFSLPVWATAVIAQPVLTRPTYNAEALPNAEIQDRERVALLYPVREAPGTGDSWVRTARLFSSGELVVAWVLFYSKKADKSMFTDFTFAT